MTFGPEPTPLTTSEPLRAVTDTDVIDAVTVSLPGHHDVAVELRVLTGGHQVVLNIHGRRWVETLTDVGTVATSLPVSQRRDAPEDGGLVYESRCTVTEHSSRGLQKQRARVSATCAAATGSVVRPDPADPQAGAGLCVFGFNDDDEILWRSWRIMPGDNRLVQTVSTVWVSATGMDLRRAG